MNKNIIDIQGTISDISAQKTHNIRQGSKNLIKVLEPLVYAETPYVLITWPYSEHGKNKIPGQYRTVIGKHNLGGRLYLGDELLQKDAIEKLVRWLKDTPSIRVGFPNNCVEIIYNGNGIMSASWSDRNPTNYGITPNSVLVVDPEPIIQKLEDINLLNTDISRYLNEMGLLKPSSGE